jgi:5S rRNA maturation endonuclease (ribonuclease M5)
VSGEKIQTRIADKVNSQHCKIDAKRDIPPQVTGAAFPQENSSELNSGQ